MKVTCGKCNGTGEVFHTGTYNNTIWKICPKCKGDGYYIERCPDCNKPINECAINGCEIYKS